MGLASSCFADDINWVADMLVRTQYQDNVTLSEISPLADTSAQLALNTKVWRKTETQESDLSLAVKDDNYLEYHEFEQDSRGLALSHLFKQEIASYSLKADINRSTTLANGFEAGEFVRRNMAVNARVLTASANRSINEFTSAGLTGSLNRVRYEHEFDSDSQDYNDSQYSAAVTYQDDETANWQVSIYTDMLDQLQNGLEVDTKGVTLQRNYKWNEIWSLSAKLGRRKTGFAGYYFWGERFSQEDFGRVSTLDIKRAGEVSSWGLGASEDLSPRVNGVIDETRRLGFWWETKPSVLSTVKLSISHVQRKPINVSFIRDDATRYNTLIASWQHAISETISTDMQLRWVEREITSSINRDSAHGGTVALGLRWQMHP